MLLFCWGLRIQAIQRAVGAPVTATLTAQHRVKPSDVMDAINITLRFWIMSELFSFYIIFQFSKFVFILYVEL